MNASSRASAASATKMAVATNAAGPGNRSLLKAEPITQSEIRVGSALAALLVRSVRADVLARRYGKPQSCAEGLRGKASDLIDAREVLRARCKKDVARKLLVFSPQDRESQARNFRGAPLGANAWEGASRFGQSHRNRPLARQ